MTAFAISIGANGLLVQQLGFTATTLLGLRRSGWLAWHQGQANRGIGTPAASSDNED